MARAVLTAAVFLVCLAMTGSAVAASCNNPDRIRAAFVDNIAYQAQRAEKLSGGAAAEQIRDGFDGIATRGVSCADLYEAYKRYLQRVRERNERAEGGGGIFQFKFRKW